MPNFTGIGSQVNPLAQGGGITREQILQMLLQMFQSMGRGVPPGLQGTPAQPQAQSQFPTQAQAQPQFPQGLPAQANVPMGMPTVMPNPMPIPKMPTVQMPMQMPWAGFDTDPLMLAMTRRGGVRY